jgi:hypothetical protein
MIYFYNFLSNTFLENKATEHGISALMTISFPFFVAFFGFLLSGLTCLCERIFWTPKIIGKTSWQIQVNQSKNVLHSEIGHLKSVLRQANAFKWDWLDEMLVKIQDSQVQYDQL